MNGRLVNENFVVFQILSTVYCLRRAELKDQTMKMIYILKTSTFKIKISISKSGVSSLNVKISTFKTRNVYFQTGNFTF